MTIGIDMVGTNLPSGTKTYNLNFCRYLNELVLKEKTYIFLSQSYTKEITTVTNSKIQYIIKSDLISNIFLRFIWMQFFLPFELKRLKIDKFFSPMNFGPLFLKFFNIKFILALHTNLPWVYFNKMPGNLFRNYLTKLIMKMSINACDNLIVASNYAKEEIVKQLNLDISKVTSIYLGIDNKYFIENKYKKNLDNLDYSNYILSVLSCVKYHNIINLLKAFKILKKEIISDLKFVLVLQILDKNYFKEIQNYVKNNFKKDEIIFLHNLEHNHVFNLYQKAKFFIFSSYCEVFGFTSLEAMSQNCPVLISNRSALPEINSDAADYFNPDDVEETGVLMKKLISDSQYKKILIEKGNLRFKKFNWSQTVKETLKILEN